MRRDDVRFAVAAREDGLRRVKSLTTRIGAVGVVSSAAIAVALGHPAGAAVHAATGNGTASQNRTGRNGPGSSTAQGNSAPGSSPSSSSAPQQPPIQQLTAGQFAAEQPAPGTRAEPGADGSS